jgi:signal transduction histidine kinase
MKQSQFWRNIYLLVISTSGLLLLGAAVWQLPSHEMPFLLLALIVLGIAAQLVSTSALANVSYEVGSAVSVAAVPIFGPLGGALVAISSHIGYWLIQNYQNSPGWRKSAEQIGFNGGMHGIAIFLAGSVYLFSFDLLSATPLPGVIAYIMAWLLTAVVGDQLNFWILATIIYLQHNVGPGEMWWENRWAMPINVLLMAAGGGALAFAIQELGLAGVIVFFLPVFLSSYAFRMYVASAKEQMNKLEDLVSLRTSDLTLANRKLADLNKDKDAFLAVLTHDMRTPLTSILGYTGLLKDRRELTNEERDRIADVILRNGKALLEIVNNILDIEQLQSGAPVLLERQNFDLQWLISETIESIEAQAIEKHITLEFERLETPVIIHADASKLQRIMANLLSNGIKYTPEGGCVMVSLQSDGRYVSISFQDTGYGIPAEELPYIFDRYRRVREHKDKAVGTGLGLTIVKSLVEAHDGEISVTSEEGVGSQFTVKLPA